MKPATRRILFRSAILYVVAIFAVMFLAFPVWNDDLWFLGEMGFRANGRVPDIPLSEALFGVIRHHYLTDVARLGNSLAMCLLLLPEWLVDCLTSVMFGLMFIGLLKLAEVRDSALCGLSAVTAGLIFCWHWNGPMWGIAYVLNYIWSSALLLWAMLWLIYRPRLNHLLAFVMGLIIGLWHESFALTLFGGIIVNLVINRPKAWKHWVVMLCGVCSAMVFTFTSPAFCGRASLVYGPYMKIEHGVELFWVFITVGLCLTAALRKQWRRLLLNRVVLFFIASLGLFVPFLWTAILRAITPCMLLAVPASVILLRGMWPQGVAWGRVRNVAAACLWILIVANTVLLTAYIFRLRACVKGITEYCAEGSRPYGDKIIPADIEFRWDVNPLIFRNMDVIGFYPESWTQILSSLYFTGKEYDEVKFIFLPRELLEIDPMADTRPLAGDVGARISPRGCLILPPDATADSSPCDTMMIIGYSNGTVAPNKVILRPFPAADGRQWLYAYPERFYRASMATRPVSVNSISL